MESLVVDFGYKNRTKSKGTDNFSAECKFCLNKVISGNIKSSSNFLKHLKEKHHANYKKFLAEKESRKQKRPRCDQNSKNNLDSEILPKKLKQTLQTTVTEVFCSTAKITKISQTQFNVALAKMIVKDMQPARIVERDGFNEFCKEVVPYITVPSRRTVGRCVNDLFASTKAGMEEELSKAAWISTTADLWSSHHRAYMGVTAHFIDEESLERKSYVLACRRFKFEHTAVRIAEMLVDIFNAFGILSRVKDCVTDNAANFAKAFRIFAKEAETNEDELENEHIDDEELEVEDLFKIFQEGNESEETMSSALNMPPHKRCSNHTLNLVASVDTKNARKNVVYKRLYDRTMGKVQYLSNVVHRSTKFADYAEDITGTKFLNPTCVRWSSDYAACKRMLDMGIENIRKCEEKLNRTNEQVTEADMNFLSMYVDVMKPIAIAMKMLEGEENCYLGHVVPTILGILDKFDKMNKNATTISSPLINAITEGIKKRFGDILCDNEYLVASMLVPRFKMNFLEQDKMISMEATLVKAVEEGMYTGTSSIQLASANDEVSVNGDKESEDLFSYLSKSTNSASATSSICIRNEVSDYLRARDVETESLKRYPNVKSAFIKYNCTLPSSAVVERLFSMAGQVLVPKRCRLSDVNFEKMVILRGMLKK